MQVECYYQSTLLTDIIYSCVLCRMLWLIARRNSSTLWSSYRWHKFFNLLFSCFVSCLTRFCGDSPRSAFLMMFLTSVSSFFRRLSSLQIDGCWWPIRCLTLKNYSKILNCKLKISGECHDKTEKVYQNKF